MNPLAAAPVSDVLSEYSSGAQGMGGELWWLRDQVVVPVSLTVAGPPPAVPS
ncbi:hypothetical protein ABN028_12800 [Actinopolymorpha sp. B17G11]